MGFVRKVYSILGAQLVFTSLFILFPIFNDGMRVWMAQNFGLLIAACIGQILTSILLLCCRGLSRSVPINYILLGLFTACEAYLLGFIASYYNPITVLAAASATAGITIAISIYAWTTKKDFTVFGPVLLIVGFVFCIMSLFAFVFGRVLNMIFCGIAVILFSFYLLFDT
jgi:FtsH-binding integral membrane protein